MPSPMWKKSNIKKNNQTSQEERLSLLERRNMESLKISIDIVTEDENDDGILTTKSADRLSSPWDVEVEQYLKKPRRKAITNLYKHQVMFSWVVKKITAEKLRSRKSCVQQH